MDWLRRLFQRPQQNNRAQDIINRSRNWGSAAQDLRNAGFNPTQFDAQLKNKFQPRPQPQQQPQQPQGPHLNIQAFAKGLQDFIQHDVQQPVQKTVIPAIGKALMPGATIGSLAAKSITDKNQRAVTTDAVKSFIKDPLEIPGQIGGLAGPAFNLANNNPIQRQLQALGGKSVGKSDQRIKAEQARQADFNNEVVRQAMGISNNMVNAVENNKRLQVKNPNSLPNQGARLAGGLAANIGLSMIAPGAAPAVYGAQGGGASAQSTYNQTGNINKATATAIPMGAINAAMQKIAVDRYIHPSSAAAKNLLVTPLVQGGVGAGSQFATNLVNNRVIDNRQSLTQGVPQAGALGAAIGLGFGGLAQVKGAHTAGKVPTEEPISASTPTRARAIAYDLSPVRDNVGKYSKKPNTIPLQLDNMKAYQQDMLNTMTRPGISATEKAGAMKNYNATQKVIDQLESGQPLKLKGRPINDNFNGNLNPIKSSLDVIKYPNAEAFAKAHPEVTTGLSKAQINELYQTAQKAPSSVVAGLDSRPAHQVAIENALNKGDITTAKQLVAQIPKDDPYRASMESFVNDAGVQTAKYNQATKPSRLNPFKDPLESLKQEARKYLYHGTNEDVLENITKEGLKPGRRGQLSLSKTEDYAKSYAKTPDFYKIQKDGVIFRVNAELLKGKTTTKRLDGKARPKPDQINELLTKETIPPEALEVYRNGKWQPLIEATQPPKSTPVQSSPLESLKQEARKYKSADEFVKAQTNAYHGTDATFDTFDNNFRGAVTQAKSAKNATFFTDDPRVAKAYATYAAENRPVIALQNEADRLEKIAQHTNNKEDWLKYDAVVAKMEEVGNYDNTFNRRSLANVKNAKVSGDFLEVDAKGKSPQELSADGNIDSWLQQQIDKAKAQGKDGVKFTNLDDGIGLYDVPSTHYAVFDNSKVLTEKQLTDLYNQATKGKPIYDNYTGPLKPEKGKKVDKIAEGLGMTEQQVNEAAGKSAPGLSIKDTNTLKKLGYTVDDFANLKPGELKLALQKGLPRDQVYKGLSAVPDLTTPKGPGEKPRGFISSLNKDILFPSEVSGALPQGYKPITNKQTVEQARRLVDADPSASLSRFLTKPQNEVTAVDQAIGQIHLRRAIDTENTALATRLIGKIDPNAREAGRTVQILAAWKKTTPEGALSTAHKIVDEANAKLGKNKQLTLSADAQKRIVEIAKNIQKFEVGTRDRQVQEALLQKELAGIVPAGKLRKISTLQTLGQLLNPKTAIRNIGGNSFLAGTENVSQSIATPLDAILGKFTKQRSVVLPKLGQELKGAKIGAQYGAEDVKLGIKSQGAEGQYSLHPDIFKKGSLLNKAEKLMGYELSVPDKAFYTAAYNESLANQVAAANKTGANLLKPTAQMKLQAESEGLYRTFQNDSKLAGWLSSAKHGLNVGKDFGMGDLILKYPRTPGNIVSVGIDYAGGGAVKGVNKLVRNWGNLSAETQRQAVMDISRSITGLGMAGGAYALAKEGIIKGKQNKDKDIASAEKGMGQGPYTINLSALARKLQGKPTEARPGDLTTNYDWIQPNAINAAIGANMASKTGTKQGIANIAESLNQGVSTVVDQPVMQGLARFASSMTGVQGADPVGAIVDAIKGAPASFSPSLLNQIGQLTDKTSRNTYSPNPIQESANMIKAKIPGLRTTLNPRYDTLGKAQQLYESNNPFNVFLNPAFVNHYKNNPVIDEVRRLEQTTSETSQYPRLVNTSQTINGQNRKLTSDELAKWQKGLGELTNNQLSTLIQTPAYQKLSDPDKVKAIQNALTSFNQITKNTIFGGEKLSKAEQAVAGGGNYAIKEKQPPKAKKAKKLKAPKKSTGGKRATGRKSSGRVAITKPPALHLSKLSIGRSPSIKSVKLKSTTKLVSPKTSSKKITIKA